MFPFYGPLKIPKKQSISGVSWGYKMGNIDLQTSGENQVNICSLKPKEEKQNKRNKTKTKTIF